jgi:predicted transglutaminase-like cysteine proteinase
MNPRRLTLLILTAVLIVLAVLIVWAHDAKAQPAELVEINDEVNTSIRYRSDLEQYGVVDWQVANPVSGMGDCEDYALTKRHRLGRGDVVVVGWRDARQQRRYGHHAVLVVDGWVLDNIERRVVPVETARRYYTGL